MATVGLIDVDGHNFPNLALMRLSTYHKKMGDTVKWWWTDFEHYDVVYMSKIFSAEYSQDIPEPLNADLVIKGGTGYAIHNENGKEVLDQNKNNSLPAEVENQRPDYALYPQYDFAVSMTTRGCPRGCPFCHVAAKEGRRSVKVADVCDFYDGQKVIKILDPNITACPNKYDLYEQYIKTGALLDFTQGLDIRLLQTDDLKYINKMRLTNIHFAWDNPAEDLQRQFERYAEQSTKKMHGSYGTVYVLTNFENCTESEHIERALYRINTLARLGFDPYLMVYNKTQAPPKIRELQRWCNNRFIFNSCSFEDYKRGKTK